jgi:hypothetical protein
MSNSNTTATTDLDNALRALLSAERSEGWRRDLDVEEALGALEALGAITPAGWGWDNWGPDYGDWVVTRWDWSPHALARLDELRAEEGEG